SNIHAGTGANNEIPGELALLFNFRFSPESSVEDLKARVHRVLDAHSLHYQLSWSVTAQPFMTARGPLTDAMTAARQGGNGCTPDLSTSGGTSDGRFLATIAREVVEFGPLNDSIHKIDERVRIADIGPLSVVYERTAAILLES